LGDLRVKAGYTDFNYGYNTTLSQGDPNNQINITNRLKGTASYAGAAYNKKYKGFQLHGDAMVILSGDVEGNYLKAGAGYEFKNNYGGQAKISTSSVAPNYNFQLYQSDYINYNWQNSFKNIETQKLEVDLKAKKFANIKASFSSIDNYTYFTKNQDSATIARQSDERVNLLKLRFDQSLKFGWLGLDNTVTYQEVLQGSDIYRVPQVVTRNTLYYQDYWFSKALFLQTGVTFKYYTAYDADGYDPVLAEFYVQNDDEIAFFKERNIRFGGFPQFDLFFNARIRQTRIYFKVENFGEAFKQNTEFSAPGYAPRDAVIRFGLVWNFFM